MRMRYIFAHFILKLCCVKLIWALKGALKSMEQMMQQLVEDHRQREEEFASERATWQRAADDRIREMQALCSRSTAHVIYHTPA